jgi:hypothetical protein
MMKSHIAKTKLLGLAMEVGQAAIIVKSILGKIEIHGGVVDDYVTHRISVHLCTDLEALQTMKDRWSNPVMLLMPRSSNKEEEVNVKKS